MLSVCDCPYPKTNVLCRMDCGAGGIQYRYFCTNCWRAGNALPHAEAATLAARTGIETPLADREVIDLARQAYDRRRYG